MPDDTSENPVAGIFTSKTIGALFALAFGSWSWTLHSVKDAFIEKQDRLERKVIELERTIVEHEIYSASATAEFRSVDRENAREVEELQRRLEVLEKMHGKDRDHFGNIRQD